MPSTSTQTSISHNRLYNALYSLPDIGRRKIYMLLRPQHYQHLQNKRRASDDYNAASFLSHRCIFVHIPKTAGLAVGKALFGNKGYGHAVLCEYKLIFSKVEFDDCFKFSIVRNPWDRLYSAYNFLISGGTNERNKQWAAEHLTDYKDFTDFVYRFISKPKNLFSYYHFLPQYHFICRPFCSKIDVDFVGFYENLANDYQFIQQTIFANKPALPLPHTNKTTQPINYQDAYTETTKAIVATAYKKDIKIFGYNFDNTSLPTQLANRTLAI